MDNPSTRTVPVSTAWAQQSVYNGQFIDCGGYGGVVQAFDAKTGTSLWNWTAPSVGLDETPYQNSHQHHMAAFQVTDYSTSTQASTQTTTQSDVTHKSGMSTLPTAKWSGC